MTTRERRSAGAIASIVALRLFGLFLILPVFAALARDMPGATPQRIGLAIGIYGLTQGLLQVPFGWLSDRVGRRPVIAAGLLLFIAGSVLAALSTNIAGVIAGRALQGGGAISGAAMAFAADNSRPETRSRIMAIIGGAVGGAFVMAMLAGPVLAGWWGIAGLFWITALLGALAFVVLFALLPGTSARPGSSVRLVRPSAPEAQLCVYAFLLHLMLTAAFVALPVNLEAGTGLEVTGHWRIYLPSLALAGVFTLAMIFRGREDRAWRRLLPGVLALTLACGGLALDVTGWAWALAAVTVFFAGFNLLEATLPALLSHAAPAGRRGSIMGLYATSQFLGAFAGGVAGGWTLGSFGMAGVLALSASVGVAWLILLRLAGSRLGRLAPGP